MPERFLTLLVGVLLVLGALVPDSAFSAASKMNSQVAPAPFGLEGVTTPEVTPERFAAALPEEFEGIPRASLGFTPVEAHVHGFSTSSEEFHYLDPADAANIWVVINDLGTEPTVASALESVYNAISPMPGYTLDGYTIEQVSISPEADVPFFLASQNSGVFSVVWGAGEGNWVFSVFASSSEARERFVRSVVANLGGPASAGDGGERDPSADSSNTPVSTMAPIQLPTATATRAPSPTPTAAPSASGDAPSTSGGPGGVATTAPVVRVETEPDVVYGEIYTVSLHCEEVQVRWQGGVDGYCSWQGDLPAGQAACIEDDGVTFGRGENYLCKSRFSTATESHPDEVTVYNAPEEIYSVEVRCSEVTERNGVIYGDCDVPAYSRGMTECIEDDEHTWSGTTTFLCKP